MVMLPRHTRKAPGSIPTPTPTPRTRIFFSGHIFTFIIFDSCFDYLFFFDSLVGILLFITWTDFFYFGQRRVAPRRSAATTNARARSS